MRNITLKNGKHFVVDETDLDDLAELVREELSPELADALEAIIEDKVLEYDGLKRLLAEENEACEDSLSDARNALDEISMCIDELTEDIRNGMTEQDKIIEELERIKMYAFRAL